VLHLEDEDVAEVLSEWPPNIPVHVAHVSSQQELEAVISAKEDGKDVSCEATPHHLFLTEKTREALGPLGCMKPSLKTESDRKFLWQHLRHIDIFASDCAPHRHADKFGPDGQGIDNPAFGVTNHDVFMPLFLQAVIEDGLLTETELYERIVSNPIRRFHLPVFFTKTRYELKSTTAEEAGRYTEYGFNPFEKSPETPAMLGKLASMTINGQGSLASLGSDPFILRGQVRPGYNNLLTF
ncbi:MAG TPA: hypothetical protein VFB03_03150, partial [Candidatus Saccharimonadales bacterium]|nr:hypothetical protein [Candidatus Saccharimonadales bacterium]